MAAATTDALFVTANVGSIFEDPTSMLRIWCDEFLNTISRLTPKVIALHCQEVGGKNYERSMQHVSEFVKLLMSSEELQPFNKVRIYLDEDYSSAEHFTALGNFYFIHESIPDEYVQIFNFQEKKFEYVVGKEVFSENIEDVPTKEKSKFPQEIFPECKWSRKGFMRTRWNINGTVFDLVNIHLFHDASNFVAMESFPSVYCKNRQRALDHTLKRFHTDQYGNVPFFVFGDFNFRTDTQGVVKKLSEGLNAVKVQGSKSTDHTKLQYRDESSQVVFTLGKKEFSHQDHQKLFLGGDSEWLREFDRELESFDDQLFEFNIDFPPSYPYVEDSEKGELYMQTRCPSWCDRVFLSSSARTLVDNTAEDSPLEYGLIGLNACMGDHKPVYLRAALIGGLGTVSCCALPASPCTSCLSAATPLEHICRLCAEQTVEPSSFPLFAEPQQDHSGLVVPKFHRHTSPYTPDSTDTEPDLGEETCREEPIVMKTRNDRRLSRFDLSRKRLHITDKQYEDTEEDGILTANALKSFSKIPVRITDRKETNSVTRVHVSKLPVPKTASSKPDKDFNLKCKTVKHASAPASKDNLDKRLTSKKDIPCPSNQGTIIAEDLSFVAKPKSVDGRKLCRQMNVNENSSDSDSASLDIDDQYRILEQRAEEPKVEIQFSLVETSPDLLSPIDCESDGLLTTKEHRLGGSTTDSGVSVSPDFSVANSPSTDGQDKIAHETISNVESNFEVDLRGETNSSSLERFSFVRRIQSASAMERKSSFPFPSSTFVETESTLSGFGGSGSNLWGMRTCRCMSDGSWRQRSSTISHSMLSSRADSRIRLISTSSHLDRSLPRLQSHHSSSDEEWFEEITNDLKEEFKTERGQALNSDTAKVKRKAELTKRLSTHQECEKTSDPNVSVEEISSIITSTEILQDRAEVDFKGQDHKPSTRNCKSSMALPSRVQTSQIDDASCSAKARTQPQEIIFDELMESSASDFLLKNNELLNHDESKTAAEKPTLPIRRSSVNSDCSKNQNSKTCKACCIVS
ncbi:Inositol polyphosphate-5-phosphatase A [Frankliniella fusca]|uniref:inositol-polyphosphate 5-phosphatase n=1 Tax=Frankliniella fusca TaxID=407009 RepID=A0AAE1HHI1_9NEOP|nr:Inositol polyphosphate-5-phosphatase A [Frankliniella fusca]